METIFLFTGILIGLIISYFFFNKKIKELNLYSNQQKEQNIELRAELENAKRNKQILENTIHQSIEEQVLRAM